jgi:hypothetical protein
MLHKVDGTIEEYQKIRKSKKIAKKGEYLMDDD